MIWIADAHHDDGKRFVAVASANRSTLAKTLESPRGGVHIVRFL
jgi:hypothetical protein